MKLYLNINKYNNLIYYKIKEIDIFNFIISSVLNELIFNQYDFIYLCILIFHLYYFRSSSLNFI